MNKSINCYNNGVYYFKKSYMKKLIIFLSVIAILASCNSTQKVEDNTSSDKVTSVEQTSNVDTNNIETSNEQQSGDTQVSDIPSTWTSDVKLFTLEDVAIHDTKEDCYTIIDWKIYDISNFFWKHPWWDKSLLKLCWIDWSKLFNWKHWDNEKAIMKRDSFYVWDLK